MAEAPLDKTDCLTFPSKDCQFLCPQETAPPCCLQVHHRHLQVIYVLDQMARFTPTCPSCVFQKHLEAAAKPVFLTFNFYWEEIRSWEKSQLNFPNTVTKWPRVIAWKQPPPDDSLNRTTCGGQQPWKGSVVHYYSTVKSFACFTEPWKNQSPESVKFGSQLPEQLLHRFFRAKGRSIVIVEN